MAALLQGKVCVVTGASAGIGKAAAVALAAGGAHVVMVCRDAGRGEQARSDGLERTFALNHLAPFLLTNLLLDRIRASAPARIVTVSSDAHRRGQLDLRDLQAQHDYRSFKAYADSKLCNVLFTYELARRLAGTGVTATAMHPGGVRTNISGGASLFVRLLFALFARRTPQ